MPFEVVIRHENARALHLIQLQNTLLFDNGGKRQHFEDQGSNVIYGKEYETHTHTHTHRTRSSLPTQFPQSILKAARR